MTEPTPSLPGRAARIGLLAGPIAFLAVLLLPLPDLALEGRTVAATTACHVALGLAAWMATWWMTEPVPLAATSLLPLVVLPLGGVATAKGVASSYFDDVIALFLGGFALAVAVETSGLHRRIALGVLRPFGSRPRGMVLGFLVASAALSMWMSNTATTLLLLPVVVTTVAAVLPGDASARTSGERSFAAACALAVAFGASLGGMGTLVGTPPNMLLKGTYDAWAAANGRPALAFGSWLLVGVPLVAVLLPVAWAILTRVALRVPARLAREPAPVPSVGAWRRPERRVLAVFVVTALAWATHARIDLGGLVVPGTGWDAAFAFGTARSFVADGTIATAAALALFLLPSGARRGERLLTWEALAPRVPWGALLLFGGGFALAEGFRASGLDAYLKAAFAGLSGLPAAAVVLIVVAGVALLSEVASNTASAAMLLPVLLSVATATGAAPLPLLVAGTLGASCGYALPVATPPNTIAYASGLVTAREMGRAGLWLDVAAVAVIVVAVLVLVPAVLG